MQNMDGERKKAISLGLFHTLDSLGYSPQMVKLRRKHYRNEDFIKKHISHQYGNAFVPKIVGSKAEGGSRVCESDFDHLHISKNVVCIEFSHLKYTESLSKLNSVYTMVSCLFHPGHFKLLLTRDQPSPVTKLMSFCLNPSDSGYWLSSKEILRLIKSINNGDATAGPAVCKLHTADRYDEDMTITLRCFCPSILGNWIQRNRKYNWPPSEVIKQISQMCGNLVATGIKGCHDEEIEWRLCFNEIEILLVENWSETEAKLYVVLKMIKKDILKLGNNISSYMIKNIVFWLSERYPQTDFRPDTLFSWKIKALRLLKRTVKKFHLPYYMIPERNLIAEKLPKYNIKYVIKQINSALNLGPQLLWNCKKIEMAMSMSLSDLQFYQQKTDNLELLELLARQDYYLKCKYLGITVSDWKKTDYKIAIDMSSHELVYGPWPQVVQHQLSECKTYIDMFKLLLK